EREMIIHELDNCLGSTTAYESSKLLREMNDTDLAKTRDRVFQHRVGLTITSLDLLGVIEDEEYFSKLCDANAIRVCLLLCLEVIFMGRLLVTEVDDTLMRLVDSLESWNAFPWGEHIWMHLYDEIMNVVSNIKSEHLEGLHKSPKYVPTYTLSGFVWAFKDSNPIVDLRPTLAEYKSEWWISTNDYLQVYVPRTPIRNHDIFYAYLQKVLGRERNGDVVEKLQFSDDFFHGWLLDEHIDLWVDYMWHVRPNDANWAMVNSYFVQLLLQNAMPLWCVNGESGDNYNLECHDWYIRTRDCLQVRLPEVLELLNVFDKKGIAKSTYQITFTIAENVPKQGVSLVTVGSGYVFFLYRLAHDISLDVEDPVQAALAYRERMAQFYYNHKVV
ncbi:hypothetical protein Tco_0428734, partial [Tanacetum coccineum]